MRSCGGITDVSALGRVTYLDLSDCENITDVSALGNVRTLFLDGCIRVTDAAMMLRCSGLRRQDENDARARVKKDVDWSFASLPGWAVQQKLSYL
jgi:hypothetical protein